MRPVIKRVSDCMRNGVSIVEELLIVVSLTLVIAVSAHLSPLIVVAVKPCACDAGLTLVPCDLRGNQMAVVVEDRHLLGILMEQPHSAVIVEKEVLVHELFHIIPLSCQELNFSRLIQRPRAGFGMKKISSPSTVL